MTLLRPFLATLLALLLVLSTFSVGHARGMESQMGQMVICTGTGTAIIYTDETGAPTGPPHQCPDCVMALDAPLLNDHALRAQVESSEIQFSRVTAAPILTTTTQATARGPPRSI